MVSGSRVGKRQEEPREAPPSPAAFRGASWPLVPGPLVHSAAGPHTPPGAPRQCFCSGRDTCRGRQTTGESCAAGDSGGSLGELSLGG